MKSFHSMFLISLILLIRINTNTPEVRNIRMAQVSKANVFIVNF